MHLHRVKQLVVAKEDWALDQPYFVDTLTICPGERYTVLISPTAEETGIWAWHCHILTHAETEEGLKYMVTVLVVPAAAPGGQERHVDPLGDRASEGSGPQGPAPLRVRATAARSHPLDRRPTRPGRAGSRALWPGSRSRGSVGAVAAGLRPRCPRRPRCGGR